MKIRYKCSNCGGTNIKWDAWSEWDEDEQEQILVSSFDNTWCDDCEGECNVIQEEYE